MTSVTPEQQAFLDARRIHHELREQHIRRTQVIAGRVYLGRWLRRINAAAWLACPIALVLVSLGWLNVKASQGDLAGLIPGGIAIVLLPVTSRRPHRPAKALVRWLGVAVFGAAIFSNQAAAMLLGGLLVICGFAFIASTSIWVVCGRLRGISERPRPTELPRIEQKPAA